MKIPSFKPVKSPYLVADGEPFKVEDAPTRPPRDAALLGDLEERIAALEVDLASGENDDGGPLGDSRFQEHRVRFGRDEISHRMWLDVYILDVRFPLGEADLSALDTAERGKLEELATILGETFAAEKELEVYVDGHADSRRFEGRSACVSAALNKDLSRRRAEAVRTHLTAEIDGLGERIEVDWYGNFSRLAGGEGEDLRNRRIELRVALGTDAAHTEYFAIRNGLDWDDRRFVHRSGRWSDARCLDREPDGELEYLSNDALGLMDASEGPLRRGIDGRQLEIRLGDDVVVEETGRCLRITPCALEP